MNLYELDKHSTKCTIWKYWKGCVKKLDGNDLNFLPTTHESHITTMPALSQQSLVTLLWVSSVTVINGNFE